MSLFCRHGPFEVDSLLAKALEDQLIRELSQNEDTDSEDESDNLPLEWEAVSLCVVLLK